MNNGAGARCPNSTLSHDGSSTSDDLRLNPTKVSTPVDPATNSFESTELQSAAAKVHRVESVEKLLAVADPELRETIQATKWIVGAVNLDEDLHFSSYYLRASAKSNLPKDLSAFGYSQIIAVFHDLNERYFLSENECASVSNTLLKRMIAAPEWFQNAILDEIYKRADQLATVFPESIRERRFSSFSLPELQTFYSRHHHAHTRLYEVARVPETLDRGSPYFSSYLREHLRRLLPADVDAKRLSETFETLTYPEEQSKLVEEIEDLLQLAQEIRDQYGENVLAGTSKRMLMFLAPTLVGKLQQHRDKWSFWGYHGYGSKATYDLDHYIKRIQDRLHTADRALNPAQYREALRENEQRRIALFRELAIDLPHQYLFRFYARIGNAKLYRRYIQLRNFYFVDQLLAEFAHRMNISEAAVRSLLPAEILRFCEGHEACSPLELKHRTDFAVLVISNKGEKVYAGLNWKWLELQLEAGLPAQAQSANNITGLPLCQGIARGRCKILNRREDIERVGFKRGDILVSQSADPELADCIADAAGVLVESGGVTCHAATVCRQLGKPAISNIPLSLLKNDDYVFIDAYSGIVQVRSIENFTYLRHSTQIPDFGESEFGAKASTLARLQRSGIKIPSFFAIPVGKLTFLNQPADATGTARDSFGRELVNAAETFSSSLIILRSSGADEDRENVVTAGQYFSEAFVDKNDVVAAVFRMLVRMAKELVTLSGSLIVQEMILGDCSGVCFTTDPVSRSARQMVIEVVPGGNELLTGGEVTGAMFTFDRHTKVVSESSTKSPWPNVIDGDSLRSVATVSERVETLLGRPQDIEWTQKSGELWILQSRPITDETLTFALRRKAIIGENGQLRDITALCRAYRVPPNLKMHLLRVAAVGAWICRHWTGPIIDETTVIKALLLHDIGNIVKADYITNPGLFPEEMQNLKYWIAVQSIVGDRFGRSDTEATLAIAREIGVSPRILSLIEEKQFVLNEETATGSDWERKIAAYADQRVTPHGVAPLNERLEDARQRYKTVPRASVNVPNFETLVRCANDLEAQLAQHVSQPLASLNDSIIEPIIGGLRMAKIF